MGAAAARAGDDVELAGAQSHVFQEFATHLDLFGRRRGERHANRVANALGQERTERQAGFDGALPSGAGLGDAEVQRPIALGSEQSVRFDHGDDVMVFDGDLEIVEADVLEHVRFLQGRGHQ